MVLAYRLPVSWTAQTLTELKIHLRDRRPGAVLGWDDEEEDDAAEMEGMGRNDTTVRFVWDVYDETSGRSAPEVRGMPSQPSGLGRGAHGPHDLGITA